MIRPTLLTVLISLAPLSMLLAQEDKFKIGPADSMMVLKDYGLLFEKPEKKGPSAPMPIHNPQEYDAKIRLWSPPFEWFNSMPVIGAPEEKADSLNYFWNPDLIQKKRKQHK